ncbi:MAG TPA: DEAD/DEAH box helicase family protein [Phycisphaerae bacterium]|nr:DEAD/DEAH box helicase family protein [Phycisphaerae bacterium]
MKVGAMARVGFDEAGGRQAVQDMKKELTLRSKGGKQYGFGDGQTVRLYREGPGWIDVPRQWAVRGRAWPVDDETTEGEALPYEFTGTLRDYQRPAVGDMLARMTEADRFGGILSAKCGCHAKGERILMADGTAKKAEDVVVGDLLMGIDGPRRVRELHRGRQRMAKVIPNKGEPFVVNIGHILTVVWSVGQGPHRDGDVIDISVAEWLASTQTFRRHTVLYRPRVDTFFTDYAERDRPIGAYHMGMLLGDGTLSKSVGVSTVDPEMAEEVERLASEFGLRVRRDAFGGRCPTYRISSGVKFRGKNPLVSSLAVLGLLNAKAGTKFIPAPYLTMSRAGRLELLAGLMDSDGSVSGGGFDFVSKSPRLAEGVVFLCRSLGLAAHVKPCQKRDQHGKGGTYYRVSVSGDCSVVPTRVPRKRAPARKINKDVQRVGFKVKLLPEGDYYGFTVDRDNRYLMGDFTWTHNSGKTVMAASLGASLGRKMCVLVHAGFLVKQWRETFLSLTDLTEDDIGMVQQAKCEWEGRKVVIAMVESLVGEREYPPEMFRSFGTLVADEVHRHGAFEWSRAAGLFPARHRIGLSATPRRADGLWDVIKHHFGDVLVNVERGGVETRAVQVNTGVRLPPSAYSTRTADVALARLINALVEIGPRNDLIVGELQKAAQAGRRVLVLSHRLEHLATLAAQFDFTWPLDGEAPKAGRYVGGMKDAEIEESQTCQVVFGTYQYAKEGLDDPSLDTLFLTTPAADIEQAAGRIERDVPGKKSPLIVDFVDDGTAPCVRFAKKRRWQYQQLGIECA